MCSPATHLSAVLDDWPGKTEYVQCAVHLYWSKSKLHALVLVCKACSLLKCCASVTCKLCDTCCAEELVLYGGASCILLLACSRATPLWRCSSIWLWVA